MAKGQRAAPSPRLQAARVPSLAHGDDGIIQPPFAQAFAQRAGGLNIRLIPRRHSQLDHIRARLAQRPGLVKQRRQRGRAVKIMVRGDYPAALGMQAGNQPRRIRAAQYLHVDPGRAAPRRG